MVARPKGMPLVCFNGFTDTLSAGNMSSFEPWLKHNTTAQNLMASLRPRTLSMTLGIALPPHELNQSGELKLVRLGAVLTLVTQFTRSEDISICLTSLHSVHSSSKHLLVVKMPATFKLATVNNAPERAKPLFAKVVADLGDRYQIIPVGNAEGRSHSGVVALAKISRSKGREEGS